MGRRGGRGSDTHEATSDRHQLEQAVEPLARVLNGADSLPFLFVGSGLSRRYLGLENFNDLLDWAAGLTDKPLPYYLAPVAGDLPRAATEIAKAFYEVWWNEDEYRQSRKKWKEFCTEQSSPLKFVVADRLTKAKLVASEDLRSELALLGTCQVDGIITTNYDTLLESAFSDFSVFVGQQDLLLSRSYQLGEIYKIHGSIAEPNGMLLCSEDYERFAESSAYLVAKLMSVFVEHPIVFLGYSLTDPNIRVVLTSLLKCLSPAKIAEFKERFIWVDYDSGVTLPIVDDHMMDLGHGRMLPVLRVRTASFAPVFDVLAKLERAVPLGLLRRVAKNVVEIVHSTNPTRILSVSALSELADASDKLLVVGVGADSGSRGGKGFRAFDRYDLIADTVVRNFELPPDETIVLEGLPIILAQHPQSWVPVFKYVHNSGLTVDEIPVSVRSAMNRSLNPFYPKVDKSIGQMDTVALVEQYGLAKALNLVRSMGDDDINVAQLQELMETNAHKLKTSSGSIKTAFGQAAARLDRLKWGPGAMLVARSATPSTRRAEKARSPLASVPPRISPDLQPSSAAIRQWAADNGVKVARRGPLSAEVLAGYMRGHGA